MKTNSELNELASYYKEQLADGKMQRAYAQLVGFVLTLKAKLAKQQPHYTYGNVSQGYLDYTYFPIVNLKLKEEKLRFGIVLNHQKVTFELWLMGKNAQVQQEYWEKLKASPWNAELTQMPKYSVLELTLVEQPDFSQIEGLIAQIEEITFAEISTIMSYLAEIQ